MFRYEVSPQLLLTAYRRGVFPMDEDGEVAWYDPNPRGVLPLDERFHISHSLAHTLRHPDFEIRVDTAFAAVMDACAQPAPGRETTWISPEFVRAYTRLHGLGHAHSVETWRAGHLVGGLYGVSVGGLFAGESMFSRTPDSSKVALVYLYHRLRAGGFVLWDTQFITPHLARFGAYELARAEYHRRLQAALAVEAVF